MEIDGPRITVQWEITGNESDLQLADMKRTEKKLEEMLAQYLKECIEGQLNPVR